MISLECYIHLLFGLLVSSLIPLQIILHNADRIIFFKCTSDHATYPTSHIAESRDFTACYALCRIVYQPFMIWSEFFNCLPSIYFLDPALFVASYPVSHPLFLHSNHISPFPVSRCATLFSSRSSPSQLIFLCEHFFLHPCPYLINFNLSFMYSCKHHFLSKASPAPYTRLIAPNLSAPPLS